MNRQIRHDKPDHNFPSAALHLFQQHCYYISNTTEQLHEVKT